MSVYTHPTRDTYLSHSGLGFVYRTDVRNRKAQLPVQAVILNQSCRSESTQGTVSECAGLFITRDSQSGLGLIVDYFGKKYLPM